MESGSGGAPVESSVDYDRVRLELRTGDIVLFGGRTAVSRLIRRLTRSPYSHAGLVAWWEGRVMVLEAVGKGVRTSRLSIVVESYPGTCELWTTDRALDRAAVLHEAQRLLGRKYSRWKVVVNAWRLLWERGQDDAVEREPAALICSEYVSWVWRSGGIDLQEGVPDVLTRPGDIARSPALRRIGRLHRIPDEATPPGAADPSAGRSRA